MSLFDVIKYSDVDIFEQEELNDLPKKAVENWRERVIDLAIDKAEEVQDLDTTGGAKRVLDATKKFRRGEISRKKFIEIRESYLSNYGCPPFYSSYYSSYYDADWSTAAYAYASQAKDPSVDWHEEKAKAKEVFRKMLMEELNAFDTEPV